MRRLPRIVLNAATALSLALFLLTLVLLAWSSRVPRRFRLDTPQGRLTLQAHRGQLTVNGPPKAKPGEGAAAREALAEVRNDHFRWKYYPSGTLAPEFVPGPPAWRAMRIVPQTGTIPEGVRRALLAALDDPDRFLAAHCLLVYAQTPRRFPWRSFDLPAAPSLSSGPVTYDGLRIELRAEGAVTHDPDADKPGERRLPWVEHQAPGSWTFDPTQRTAIRDLWHDRLDVQVASLTYWPLLAACLILPARWCHARFRQVRRRRAGQCSACGYDLRGTPDRCPECGTIPTTKEAKPGEAGG